MAPLLLLLTLGLGAAGRDPRGVAEPVAALEALLSSGSGSLAPGTLESLVGIAGGRAHCRAGPCGKCLSAGSVLALAGEGVVATSRLVATDLPWLGAAVLVTLRDPPDVTCADVTSGRWATRARALHRAFTRATGDTSDDTGATTATTSGGPGLREVSELLVALEPNYRSESHEACVDASGVVAAGASVSPRVGAGRVLAALGALVLRGRCLRVPTGPPSLGHGPPPAEGPREQLEGPGGQRPPPSPPRAPPHGGGDTHGRSQDTLYLPPPEPLGASGGTQHPRGGHLGPFPPSDPPAPPRHGPTATSGPTATGTGSTGPTATTGPAATTGQLSTLERYVLGLVAALVVALCPLVAVALLRCPLRSPCCPRGSPRCGCRVSPPRRWLQPLLLGLAAGALSGDALLHLLPQCLGLHSHTEGPHGPAGGPHAAGGAVQPHWLLVGVLGGLYGGFVLEGALRALGGAGHQGGAQPDAPGEGGQQPAASSGDLVKMEGADPPPHEPPSRAPLPWLVTLGAAAHSLADGLALGAAFGGSWQSGVATGAALVCHELPHALGSAGVLLQSGLSGRRVLLRGLGGALPVFPGLCLALGAPGPARAWLGALATGLLLHLALGHMVPSMLWAQGGRPWVLLGVQSAGLLGGWGVLLLLALYEEGALG